MPCLFFFNDTATTEIYTLSLPDALPIFPLPVEQRREIEAVGGAEVLDAAGAARLPQVPQHAVDQIGRRVRTHASADLVAGMLGDRKSTRLNSSHQLISYAVFCLKKHAVSFFF